MTRAATFLFFFVLLAASPAAALSLDEAKAQGLIGERPDGMLGIVGPRTPQVEALVKDINDRRLAEYQKLARSTGTSVAAVQAVAGEKAMERAAPGSFVQEAGGSWRRK